MAAHASAAIALAALFACAHAAAPTALNVKPGEAFELKVGRTVTIDGEDLHLRFIEVPADSRCPVDVQCIHAGDAAVAMDVRRGSGAAERVTLHTSDPPGPRVQHLEYVLELLNLAPQPHSSRRIEQGDYVARLKISKP